MPMRRRGMIVFLVVNVIVSVGVAFLIISLLGNEESEPMERLVTFVVRVTATVDPLVTPFVTVVTATPLPGEPERAVIPEDVLEGTPLAGSPVPTIDPTLLNEEGLFAGGGEQLPEGCIEHTLAEGEFPSLIAEQYGANVFELLAVNNLDEESSVNLQIGDVLIVPLENCPLELFITQPQEEEATEEVVEAEGDATENREGVVDTAAPEGTAEVTAEVTEEATPTPTVTPTSTPTPTATPTITPTPTETPIPTVTLAPTAVSAQVEIVEVIGAGDITREAVRIRNNGNTIDISGWTLSDADGNSFIIPEGRRLFSSGEVTINTRAGENTPVLFFWGRDEAVFNTERDSGEVIVLADRNGVVQASIRLPEVNQ